VRLGRTIGLAVRTSWDALGLVCLVSLTLFAAAIVPVYLFWRFGLSASIPVRLVGIGVGLLAGVLVLAPLFAGACWLANVFIEHDEPSYADLWHGARRLYGRAVLLGLVQAAVKTVLLLNLAFYLSRGSFVFTLLGVFFLYLLGFWTMQVAYHFPLLVAAERGLLKREEEGKTPITSILAYSFGLMAVLVVLAIPCLVSGAGMALIFPGFAAFLIMQATRDQLVRFGHLPPPPDPDEPISDERWRVR
jgi:hypothetical protein